MATKKKSAKTKVSSAKKAVKSTAKKVDKAPGTIATRFTNAKQTAEQLWFVGLGVVGQSLDIVQSGYDVVTTEIKGNVAKGQAFIEDLVERGEVVQDKVDDRLEVAKDLVGDKVSSAKSNVLNMFDISGKLQALSDKLESTSARLEKPS